MNNLLVQEVTNFADVLYLVTESCNEYINNQITSNFDSSIQKTKYLIEHFATSEDPNIKDIITNLKEIISEAEKNQNDEITIIDKIRNITDIIESKNLVLSFKP